MKKETDKNGGRNMHEVIKLLFWVQAQYTINLFYNFHKILETGGCVKNNTSIVGVVHICVFPMGGRNCLGCWKG